MIVIGIAGGTCSGKTSVARKICNLSENCNIISQDNFYRNNVSNYDHPDAIDFGLLKNAIETLKRNQPATIPLYDFFNHRRSLETKTIEPSKILIVEGIFIFNPDLLPIFDIKIFIDVEADIRLLRRIDRDISQRGRNIKYIMQQYISYIKPGHDLFIEPSKKFADLIFPRGEENEIAINLIVQKIKHFKEKINIE